MEAGPAGVGPAEVGPAEVGREEVGRAEVGRAEVGPVEVDPAEVGPAVGPLSTPSIPGLGTLPEDGELFLVGHPLHPLAALGRDPSTMPPGRLRCPRTAAAARGRLHGGWNPRRRPAALDVAAAACPGVPQGRDRLARPPVRLDVDQAEHEMQIVAGLDQPLAGLLAA